METQTKAEAKAVANVQQAVPFFGVSSMEASLRFYVDGLGFVMTKQWTPDGPDKVRWCWLQHGNAALMLQEFKKDHRPAAGRQTWLWASPSAFNAMTLWQSIVRSRRAGFRPNGRSWEMPCGSHPWKTLMVTRSTLKVPRTCRKKPSSLTRFRSILLHPQRKFCCRAAGFA